MRERDVLVERYELTGLLGRGGFGEVWRAFDTRVRRTVAVKIGHPRSTEDRERFASEAHLAGTLVHPCIAALYDYGEAQYEGRPLVYLVMELVEGRPSPPSCSGGYRPRRPPSSGPGTSARRSGPRTSGTWCTGTSRP